MLLREAAETDLPAIQQIYAHHVQHGAGTFEEEPPTVQDMMARHAAVIANGLPWLVASTGGEIAGYCYAQRYHSRSAWRFTLEDAIYVSPGHIRKGVGIALLGELILRCATLNHRQLIAVIGDSNNAGSIGLHKAAGFEQIGVMKNVGYKFHIELDAVIMQRALA